MRTLTIRNMVCDRCKAAVKRVLEEHHVPVKHVDLGEAVLQEDLPQERVETLREPLRQQGFDLVDDREAALIAKIKAGIVQLVHYNGDSPKGKLSDHLSSTLNKEYSSLASLFSQVEGITIEHYFLLQRLERVKELIKYGEHTMSEIAYQTGFSSVAHLSAQFKKLTGMTPTAFKDMGAGRKPLDQVGS
jgi:AraC family transcriptional regulator